MRIPFPREHGATAMLLTSLALGQAVAGEVNLPSIYLWLLAITVFALREPLGALLRPGGGARKEPAFWTAGMLLFALIMTVLLWQSRGAGLLYLALPALLLFSLQVLWQRGRAKRSLAAEIFGTAGTALAGSGAYFAASGQLNLTAWSLWLLLAAYFVSQVFFVRWRLRNGNEKKGAARVLLLQLLIVLAIFFLGYFGSLPLYSFLALTPALLKTMAALTSREARKKVRRVGWTEVLFALFFFVLALLAYRLG